MSAARPRRLVTASAALAIVGLLVACSASKDARRDRGRTAEPGAAAEGAGEIAADSPLRVDGTSVLSDGNGEAEISTDAFVARLDALLAAGKRAGAAAWVRLRPDHALLVLSRASGNGGPRMEFVARVHDRQCGRGGTEAGWLAVARARANAPERFREADALRDGALAALREGRFQDAVDRASRRVSISAPEPLSHRIEAQRALGLTLLLAERHAEAGDAFRRASALAGGAYPYEVAHLGLLEAEARARAGDAEGTRAAWDAAVSHGAALSALDADVPGAAFWARALGSRPVASPWPSAVDAGLQAVCVSSYGPAVDPVGAGGTESFVWALILRSRARRAEGQTTLIAASRAEAAARTERWRDRLRIEQARALVHMGEASRATPVLASLVERGDPTVAPTAMALWGSIELGLGRTERGRALLEKSLSGADTVSGDHRLEAEANLGLALLVTGKEEEGLRRLREAGDRFRSVARTADWMRTLENELLYVERSGDVRRAGELKALLAAAEANAG